MIPPRFRSLLQGLPAEATNQVGPTRAAALARAPKSIDGTWPAALAPMSDGQLTDMAVDASTPLAVGSVAKRLVMPAAKPISEVIKSVWHGTSAEAFPKFLREKLGKGGSGGNRMGIGGYSTSYRPEGIRYMEEQAALLGKGRPHILTSRGNKVPISADDATALRNNESTLDDMIAAAQGDIESVMAQKLPEDVMKAKLQRRQTRLFDLLTARDEDVREVVRPGSLMELGLDVDPAKLLNYDKELIDQTPFVQEGIKSILGIRGAINPRNIDQQIDFRRLLRRLPEEAISKKVEDSGILGAQGVSPRGAYEEPGVRPLNFAIFDPDRIAVLRALGLAGMLGAGASRNPQQQPTTPMQNRM